MQTRNKKNNSLTKDTLTIANHRLVLVLLILVIAALYSTSLLVASAANQCTDGVDNDTYQVSCNNQFGCTNNYTGDQYIDSADPGCHTDGIVDDGDSTYDAGDDEADTHVNLRARIRIVDYGMGPNYYVREITNTSEVPGSVPYAYAFLWREVGVSHASCNGGNTVPLFNNSLTPQEVKDNDTNSGAPGHCFSYGGNVYRNQTGTRRSSLGAPSAFQGSGGSITMTSGVYELCHAVDVTDEYPEEGYLSDNINCTFFDAEGGPVGDLIVHPLYVSVGNSTVLDWAAYQATSCTVSEPTTGDNWSGLSGNETSSAFGSAGTYTYTLTCDGDDIDSEVVTVTDSTPPPPPAPTGGATSSPTSMIPVNRTGNISWWSSDTSSCIISEPTTGDSWTGLSGTETSSVFSTAGTYTYELRCDGDDGSTNNLLGTAIVEVTAQPDLESVTVADPGTLIDGQSVTFNATFDNVGNTDSGAFNNSFWFRYGSGSWTQIGSNIPHTTMTPTEAQRIDISEQLAVTETTPGNELYIMHCVDVLDEVTEIGDPTDANNCSFTVPITVSVAPPPTITTFCIDNGSVCDSAGPVSIVEGTQVSIDWAAVDATSCLVLQGSGNDFQTPGTAGTDSNIAEPSAGTPAVNFQIQCTNGSDTADSAAIQLNVTHAPPSSVTIEACDLGDPGDTTCESGTKYITGTQEVEIRWSSVGATRCEVVNPNHSFLTGDIPDGTDNSVDEPNPGDPAHTFTITCDNNGEGYLGNPVSVSVEKAATSPELLPSKNRVRVGEEFDLDYDTGGLACTITGGGLNESVGPAPSSGTVPGPLTINGETTFIMDCGGPTAEATVELIPSVLES